MLRRVMIAANPTGGGDPHWANVMLLAKFDGANASTSFADSSSFARVMTGAGAAALSTARQQFGPSSLLLNGANGNYVSASVPAMAGDFTAECWGYLTDSGSSREVFTLPGNVSVYRRGLDNRISIYAGSITPGTNSFPPNVFQHVALTRSGTALRLFLNGALEATATYGTALPAGVLTIGAYSGGSEAWIGNIDEFRLTAGVARYTAAFTPPAAPFPTS